MPNFCTVEVYRTKNADIYGPFQNCARKLYRGDMCKRHHKVEQRQRIRDIDDDVLLKEAKQRGLLADVSKGERNAILEFILAQAEIKTHAGIRELTLDTVARRIKRLDHLESQ